MIGLCCVVSLLNVPPHAIASECGCQGDRQETSIGCDGDGRGSSAAKAPGIECGKRGGHPSSLVSVAWQSWNMIWMSEWDGGCVCVCVRLLYRTGGVIVLSSARAEDPSCFAALHSSQKLRCAGGLAGRHSREQPFILATPP